MKAHPNVILLILIVPIMAWSAWEPYDRLTWWLEVSPVFAGFIALFIAQAKNWRFSNLSMVLIALHMILLIVGGHYTYARVPIGDWAKEALDLSRNHYDRLGHIFQGLTPAILCREVFMRNRIVAKRGWMSVLVVSFCMAISAIYELLEWAAALVSEEAAESFLGTQGDHWDTQTDMFCALIGATGAVVLLRFVHNRSMRKIQSILVKENGTADGHR
jgi:putative membrane protein